MVDDGHPVYRPRRALPLTDDDAVENVDEVDNAPSPDTDPPVRARRALVEEADHERDSDQGEQDGDQSGDDHGDPAGQGSGDDHGSDQPDRRPADRLNRRHPRVLAGGIVAVLVVLLSLGYAAWALTGNVNPVAALESAAGTAEPSVAPLPDRQMLDPQRAGLIDPDTTWTIVSDNRGVSDESATATCLAESVADEPPARSTRIRTLSGSGHDAPAVLHQADAYATTADATAVMATRARALGGCDTARALIVSASVGTNLGNQAVGVTVLIQGDQPSYHTILMDRTGTIVNVVDVASPTKPIAMDDVLKALAAITDSQCTSAVGLCATEPSVSDAVPPIGGTAPGFVNLADIPQVKGSASGWTPGDPVRDPTVTGTDCEGTDLSSLQGATATEARTYILSDDASSPFGFDTVLVTMPSAKAAAKEATAISKSIATCSDRVLTASVSNGDHFSGTGIRDTKLSGTAYVVKQKVDKGKTTYRYRVGVASAGNKVVYLFANPTTSSDFTDAQWHDLNVRAAQRSTQIN